MTKLLLALSLLSFTGCKKEASTSGSTSGSTAAPDGSEAVAKFTGFKDQMCKCTTGDAACVKTVADAIESYEVLHQKATKAAGDQLAPVLAEIEKCKTAAK